MVYSYNYILPDHPYVNTETYNEHAQRVGMRNIADMIYRDFKYKADGFDNWSGRQRFKIELVVFDLDTFNAFMQKLEDIMNLTQSRQLLEFLNELQPNADQQAED